MRREPAVLIAALAALVQAALIYLTSDPSYDASEIATPILTLLVGAITRQRVMPTATIREAGLNPRTVQERADDPHFQPYRGN